MRSVMAVGAVALAVLAGVDVARADLLQDLGATFERVAQDLRDSFPKVDARVVAVEAGEVRLAGPGVATLRPGLELVAYRKGQVLRHPVTNQPLGHAEEEVATLTVTAVNGDDVQARIATAEPGRALVVGDGARLTAGRIRVAVLPPQGVTVPGETADQTALLLVSRFSSLIEKTGRFLAAEPERVLELAAAASGRAPAAEELARRLGVAGVLRSRVIQEGRARALEVTWVSPRTGATLVSRQMPLVRAVYPPRFAWEQTPELERRYPLEGPVRGLALADLDGDGRPDLVVGDDRAVTLYRWQDGTRLTAIEGGELRVPGLILSVDAADLTGAGRAQIVVVESRGEGGLPVRSTVFEHAEGRFRPLYEVSGRYLRAVPVGTETWLLEQRAGDSEPYEGGARRLVWRDGRFEDGPRLTLPSGVSVYGLALVRLLGGPEPEIVALTPEDRLGVWTARGRRVWTSAEPYGGAAITFPFSPAQATRAQVEFGGPIGRIFGRIVPLAQTSPGPEILVFENLLPALNQARPALPRLASTLVTQGRIHRLRWKDGGFLRVWQSRTTDGYVADFGYGDLDGDGAAEVVVGVVPRGLNLETVNPAGRARAYLVLYELP